MINKENRFDEYAYRIAFKEADPSIVALEEGQWISFVGGKAVISDGTTKSFICLTSKRDGRDQLSGVPVKKVSYLLGSFELTVTNFDPTETYGDMVPLVVTTGGILKPYVDGVDLPYLIVAYSYEDANNGTLRICSAN